MELLSVKAATVAGATAGSGDSRRCGVGCDYCIRGRKAGAAHHLQKIASVVVAGFATLAFLHQRLHTLFQGGIVKEDLCKRSILQLLRHTVGTEQEEVATADIGEHPEGGARRRLLVGLYGTGDDVAAVSKPMQ